jgi:hypothetical protein
MEWPPSWLPSWVLPFLFGGVSLGGVATVIGRARLRLEFDYSDENCNEVVGYRDSRVIGIAIRVRVRHVFGRAATGCYAKLIELREYGAENVVEHGGQPLPWRDRDSTEGIRLKRGDVDYVNMAEVRYDPVTREVALVTNTPRGSKRVRSLPSGVYHCTVALDSDNAMSPTVSFGFLSGGPDAAKSREPLFGLIEGSVETNPAWRRWLGY